MRYVNTLLLCFNSINRQRKVVDVLKMSHLSFVFFVFCFVFFFLFFFYVDSKSIIFNLVRFDRKSVYIVCHQLL